MKLIKRNVVAVARDAYDDITSIANRRFVPEKY